MKKENLLCVFLLFLFCLTSCGDDAGSETLPVDNTQPTITGSTFYELKGYESAAQGFNTLTPENLSDPLYLQDGALIGESYHFLESDKLRLDEMTEMTATGEWMPSAAIAEGKCYWVRHTSILLYTYLKLRIAYIDGNSVGIEYIEDSTEERDPTEGNVNANAPIEGKKFVTDYSMPHLNPENIYVEHSVTHNDAEIMNYALEWVESKRHSAWVAFSFDAVTVQKNVSRTDAWNLDPQLPGICPEENDHKSDGFDKGHLCASEDRVYSKEANEQTFYYSNMSPQMSSFNGGFWASFEILVQDWARSNAYDKVYVAKGGTLDQLLVNFTGTRNGNDGVLPQTDANGFTKKGLACPKYYFMAVLSEKGSEYHAIGFWMEHRDDYGYEYDNFVPSDVMKTYAVSIDELEKNTGLDFFCNLPDDVEDAVEASWNEANWTW